MVVKAGAPVFIMAPPVRSEAKIAWCGYMYRFYGGAETQQETYLGVVGEFDPAQLQSQIDEVKGLVPTKGFLVREGFQAADPKTYATLAKFTLLLGVFLPGNAGFGSAAFSDR